MAKFDIVDLEADEHRPVLSLDIRLTAEHIARMTDKDFDEFWTALGGAVRIASQAKRPAS